MNPQMKNDKKRRLSLLENSIASSEQKSENPDLSKEAGAHLRGRLKRLEKERDEIRAELGLTEGKKDDVPEVKPKAAKPRKKATKKKRGD